MKQALILGCSHAAGAEMAMDPGIKQSTFVNFDEYGATRSYPVKIANMLGLTALNHAISGGSNDAIFRIWDKQKHQLQHDDIVIACWTGYDRGELWDDQSQQWVYITHSSVNTFEKTSSNVLLEGINEGRCIKNAKQFQNYLPHWIVNECTEPRGRLNKMKNIEALNYQAKNLGIRVINIDSFHPVWDLTRDSSWPVDTTFREWAEYRNSPKTDWGHYFEATHTSFAEYVVNKL